MGDIYKEVGEHIRARRLQQGLTLEDLSELSGLHASYIGQIERGVKKSSLKTVASLAKALGIPVGKLFDNGSAKDGALAQRLDAALRANNEDEKRLLLDLIKQLAKGLRELRK
jgi:transcriptional regulator with XRE-family HTH domain